MKNIIALCGLVLISTAATANNLETKNYPLGNGTCVSCKDTAQLRLDEVVFLEDEDPFDLGFETAEYLPEGFDPYEVYVDLDAITFIEEEDTDLGFDTAAWLPEGFDPYAPGTDIDGISYLEAEEDFFPSVDTKALLPDGFDPYASDGAKGAKASDCHIVSAR